METTGSPTINHPLSTIHPRRSGAGRADRFYTGFTGAFALATLVVVALIFLRLLAASWPALRAFGPGFVFGRAWNPVAEQFGGLPFLWGTLYSSLIALLLAVPVSLGTAAYLSEVCAPRLRGLLSFLVELLAAVPSVVYGMWGVLVLVPWLRGHVERPLHARFGFLPFFAGEPYGVGMLPAAVVLAVMITPIMTAVSRDVLRAVPRDQREGSLALGATRWETIRSVVIPYGRAGILGAVILGLGRAVGETMAVTMVIGNRPEISLSLLNPAYSMASVLANEFAEATGSLHVAALMEIGLLLLVATFLVNALARWLVWRVTRRS